MNNHERKLCLISAAIGALITLTLVFLPEIIGFLTMPPVLVGILLLNPIAGLAYWLTHHRPQ